MGDCCYDELCRSDVSSFVTRVGGPFGNYCPICRKIRIFIFLVLQLCCKTGESNQILEFMPQDILNEFLAGNCVGIYMSGDACLQSKLYSVTRQIVGIGISSVLEKKCSIIKLRLCVSLEIGSLLTLAHIKSRSFDVNTKQETERRRGVLLHSF